MKNKIINITVIAFITLMLLQVIVLADTLTLNIKANKNKVNLGDKVKITVSWDKGMQAADFILKYDSEKLEFVKSNLKDDYINDVNGSVKTAWFSIDDKDKTQIEYIFKAKGTGTAELETKINGGFATGELLMPTGYNEGNLKLKIENGNQTTNILKIVAIIILTLIVFYFVIIKIKNRKMSTKKVKFK